MTATELAILLDREQQDTIRRDILLYDAAVMLRKQEEQIRDLLSEIHFMTKEIRYIEWLATGQVKRVATAVINRQFTEGVDVTNK